MRPSVILFDVMSTLVYDPFYIEFPKAFGMSLGELLAGRDRHAWVEFERNELSEAQFFQRFFGASAEADGARMLEAICGNYRYLEGIEDLLQDLRGGPRLATLSNYPVWYERLDTELGLSGYMDEIFVSYGMGVRKPDPQAYLIPAGRLGVAPADCVFVDDRKLNCQAAVDVGMQAVLFQDAGQLRRDLSAMGLLQ